MTANNYSANIYTLPEVVDVVNRTFDNYQDGYKGVLSDASFVIRDSKGKNTGNSTLYAEPIITNRYATGRPDGTSTPISPYQYGYEKALIVLPQTHAENISYGVQTFGRPQGMLNQMKQLIQAPMNKLELDVGLRYAFAWSLSYTDNSPTPNIIDTSMGDGLSKISAVHTVTGSAATFSNQNPANPAFSKSALVAAKKTGQRGTIDNLGINCPFMPDVILTSDDEDTVLAVRELLNATANVDSSNSGTYNNYPNANLRHIASAMVCSDAFGQRDTTKEKYWFLIDSAGSSLYLTVITSPYYTVPTLSGNGTDPLSGSALFTSGMDYGIAEVSGRYTIGSKWTGV